MKIRRKTTMKRFLSAIAGLSVMATGILAASPAQAQFISQSSDLTDLLNDNDSDINGILNNLRNSLSDEEESDLKSAFNIDIDMGHFLQSEAKIDTWADSNLNSDKKLTGLGVYSKNDCSVKAGCALNAIGFGNTLKCAATVRDITDPQDWANCIKDLDYDAYLTASACTYGSCPGFATLPGQKVFACNNSVNSVLAGNSYLNLPSTLEPQKKELQISWLSQG